MVLVNSARETYMDGQDKSEKTLAVPDCGDESFHYVPILLYERGVSYTYYVSIADFEVSAVPPP